jgi:hypothetical protein
VIFPYYFNHFCSTHLKFFIFNKGLFGDGGFFPDIGSCTCDVIALVKSVALMFDLMLYYLYVNFFSFVKDLIYQSNDNFLFRAMEKIVHIHVFSPNLLFHLKISTMSIMVNDFHIKPFRRLILFYLMQGFQLSIYEHLNPTEDADLGISVSSVDHVVHKSLMS